MSWPAAILFDLDGTLIDSAPDIATAVNIVLASDGLPPLSVDTARSMIGHGIRKLVDRAYVHSGMPLDSKALDAREAAMMLAYADHLTDQTTLLDGVAATLPAIVASRAKLAIVTNKPRLLTLNILRNFAMGDMFEVVVGGDDAHARKPDPAPVILALTLLGVNAGDAVMVGDSAADTDAAKAAGVYSILVEGGYVHGARDVAADRKLSRFDQLPQALATWR
jgi:phosphoglycolate phosphatase